MRRVAFAGNAKSLLLIHALEETAGGDFFHSGGKHWASQNDPEWQVLRAWIMGQNKKRSAHRRSTLVSKERAMTTIPRTFVLAIGAMMMCTLSLSAQSKVRIIQTNSAGDNVHVIDPVTNKVVGEIKDIEADTAPAPRPMAPASTSATKLRARSTSSMPRR